MLPLLCLATLSDNPNKHCLPGAYHTSCQQLVLLAMQTLTCWCWSCLQVLAILLFVLLHDICLIWAGFTASVYLNVDGNGSNARVNQALEVYGDPVRGNLVNFASQRYHSASADHPCMQRGCSSLCQARVSHCVCSSPLHAKWLQLCECRIHSSTSFAA